MAYRKYTLKLDSVLDRTKIVERGQGIKEVFISTMPTGVSLQLALGDGELLTVSSAVSFAPTGDDAILGLYWANPTARPGVTVDVIVVADDARSGLAAQVI